MIAKILFNIYHLLFQSTTATCRYSPTCSQYTLESIQKHGYAKGGYKSVIRILSCHPFSKRPIYDPA